MPAQQALRTLSPARVVLGVAAAILVGLVCWVAVRAVGPAQAAHGPTVVVPPSPQAGAVTPLGVNVPTSPPVLSATPASARPNATTSSPAPSKTSFASPSSRRAFSATVTLGATWDSGYIAVVRVVNTGSRSLAWTVTVTHSGLEDLQLRGAWNATGRQSGTSVVLTGAPLAPGATIDAGYQIVKRGRGDPRPSGCSIVGGSCTVR